MLRVSNVLFVPSLPFGLSLSLPPSPSLFLPHTLSYTQTAIVNPVLLMDLWTQPYPDTIFHPTFREFLTDDQIYEGGQLIA